jgi:hypothetical protein
MVDFALWYDDISLCAILVENFLNHYRPLFKFSFSAHVEGPQGLQSCANKYGYFMISGASIVLQKLVILILRGVSQLIRF